MKHIKTCVDRRNVEFQTFLDNTLNKVSVSHLLHFDFFSARDQSRASYTLCIPTTTEMHLSARICAHVLPLGYQFLCAN